MLEISFTPITQTIQIFDTEKGESKEGRTRYSCSLLITDLGCRECRVHFIQGRLTHEMNTLVFKHVKAMGYVQGQLEVPEGTPATRLGEYQYTRDGLDRYTIQLGD